MSVRRFAWPLAALALAPVLGSLAAACNAVTGIDEYVVAPERVGVLADSALAPETSVDGAADATGLDAALDAPGSDSLADSEIDASESTPDADADSSPPDSGRPVWDGAPGSCAPAGYYCAAHGDCCTGVCAGKAIGCLYLSDCGLLDAACSAPYACCSSVCSTSGRCGPAI